MKHSAGARVWPVATRPTAGYDPADFSGHGLRSGFLSSAAARGASVFKLIEVSRHTSMDTLRAYIRRVDTFEDHAAEALL